LKADGSPTQVIQSRTKDSKISLGHSEGLVYDRFPLHLCSSWEVVVIISARSATSSVRYGQAVEDKSNSFMFERQRLQTNTIQWQHHLLYGTKPGTKELTNYQKMLPKKIVLLPKNQKLFKMYASLFVCP